MDKRKKSKFQRRINRIKNKMQYLRKRLAVPFICVLLCFSLISVTLFSTKQQVYATGVEEMLYYTYWDLVSGLFSEVGYQYSVTDEYYTSPKRASGEQIWDNFCTWVENKAKALSLPVAVVHDELKNLPNVVTAAGVTMSEKLAEILAKVLPTAVDDSENITFSSVDSARDFVMNLTGATTSPFSWEQYENLTNGKSLLNIVYDGTDKVYNCFIVAKDYGLVDDYKNGALYLKKDGKSEYSLFYGSVVYSMTGEVIYTDVTISHINSAPSWIIKNGAFAGADGIAQSDYARVKVKEKYPPDDIYVPGVGWKTNWDIWRDIVLPSHVTTDEEEAEWNSRYNFDNDNEDKKKQKKDNNKKDRLPIFIPIVLPHKKDDKEDTEDSTEESTEKDTEGVVVPIPKPDPTEDSSEDSTQDSTQDEDYEDVIDSAGKGGNWKRLFPFCIPWDIMTLIKSMNATKKAPHFKFEHTFKNINYTFKIDVDMSDYWKYIKIFRWGMAIFFIIGLFFLTVKFTTFVHRGS